MTRPEIGRLQVYEQFGQFRGCRFVQIFFSGFSDLESKFGISLSLKAKFGICKTKRLSERSLSTKEMASTFHCGANILMTSNHRMVQFQPPNSMPCYCHFKRFPKFHTNHCELSVAFGRFQENADVNFTLPDHTGGCKRSESNGSDCNR